MKPGLEASYIDPDNGMTKEDMIACAMVANSLNEVIIFRSTGPWSQRWIKRNYPTKNFHVKGKSSDWGPQAGFVPYLGKYSKVGGDEDKEKAGTKANNDGLAHHYTNRTQLCLTLEELKTQLTEGCGDPERTAITNMVAEPNGIDYLLSAQRSTDKMVFRFLAVWSQPHNHYKILVFDEFNTPQPLEVMTSSEVGADNKPLTGDYDLMAVCPTWASYGTSSNTAISKAGINFGRNDRAEPGQTFSAYRNLDAVLDMRTSTGLKGVIVTNAQGKKIHQTYGKYGFTAAGYDEVADQTPWLSREHDDMGNISPRILRCINALNAQMGQDGPFRRVHHNAESHRNAIFGGITGEDMKKGEAFPLTVFQPSSLLSSPDVGNYTTVATLQKLDEFKTYATALHKAGYYVPRSWTWGMSIRDRDKHWTHYKT